MVILYNRFNVRLKKGLCLLCRNFMRDWRHMPATFLVRYTYCIFLYYFSGHGAIFSDIFDVLQITINNEVIRNHSDVFVKFILAAIWWCTPWCFGNRCTWLNANIECYSMHSLHRHNVWITNESSHYKSETKNKCA